jgi:hypothetical protein
MAMIVLGRLREPEVEVGAKGPPPLLRFELQTL